MQALKMYRMALDQVPTSHQAVRQRGEKSFYSRYFDELSRAKILQNIGTAFIKMGKYSEAANALENIMLSAGRPVFETGEDIYSVHGCRWV